MNAPSDTSSPADAASLTDEVVMGEWDRRVLEGVHLEDVERARLAHLTDRSPSPLSWDELRRGLRLETRSHVGLLRLADATVRIVPRLAGGSEILPALIDYCAGLEALERAPNRLVDVASGVHLLDLVGARLVEETRRLLQRGLTTGYVEREDELDVLRGRLQPREQYLERFGAFDRLHCRFDDRDLDTWENRLVGAGLQACARHADDVQLRDEARRLARRFERDCRPEALEPARLDAHTYHRGNEDYREAHAHARWLLRGLGLDSLEAGKRSLDAFWIDMNRLFEQFVERMTRDALGGEGWHVEAQTTESAAIVDAETGEARRAVRPDLVLTSEHARGGRLPIDAKYKPLDTRPPMADLRQAALYARVFGGNETARPDAVLVYPSGPGEEETRLDRLAIREFDGVDRVEIAILATSVRTLLACDDGGRRRRSIWRRTLDSSEDMR